MMLYPWHRMLRVLRDAAGWALCGHEIPAGQADEATASKDIDSCLAALQKSTSPSNASNGSEGDKSDHSCGGCNERVADQPAVLLSRAQRIVLGSKCKQLIDKGRQQWLSEQGFQVTLLELRISAMRAFAV